MPVATICTKLVRRIVPRLPDRIAAARHRQVPAKLLVSRTIAGRRISASRRRGTLSRTVGDRGSQAGNPHTHSAGLLSRGGFSRRELQPCHLLSDDRARARNHWRSVAVLTSYSSRAARLLIVIATTAGPCRRKSWEPNHQFLDIEHLQLFSLASCRRMLVAAGFAKIQVKATWPRHPLHYWLKLVPIPRAVKFGLIRGLKAVRVGYLPIAIPAGNLMTVGYKPGSADRATSD